MQEATEHRRRLSALVQLEPATRDDGPGTAGLLRRLCSTVTNTLPATWAGISLVEDGQVGGTVAGSDPQARELEDLQFNLGEGPCIDSVRARGPVLEADLSGAGFGRWPAYAPAAYRHGARGVFAFPLAERPGVRGGARHLPGPLGTDGGPRGDDGAGVRGHRDGDAGRRPGGRSRRIRRTRRRGGPRPPAGGVPGAGNGHGRPGRQPDRGDGAAACLRLHGRTHPRGRGAGRGGRHAAARAVLSPSPASSTLGERRRGHP